LLHRVMMTSSFWLNVGLVNELLMSQKHDYLKKLIMFQLFSSVVESSKSCCLPPAVRKA